MNESHYLLKLYMCFKGPIASNHWTIRESDSAFDFVINNSDVLPATLPESGEKEETMSW